MTKYYHVSWHLDNEIEIFEPRIPKSTMLGEDYTIKRVCICENIHECLNGITYVWQSDAYDEKEQRFIPIKVYEFELDDKNVIPPTEVSKYVQDAHYTKECWSLTTIKPIKSYLIEPTYIYMSDSCPKHIVDFEFELIESDWRDKSAKNYYMYRDNKDDLED